MPPGSILPSPWDLLNDKTYISAVVILQGKEKIKMSVSKNLSR